MLILHTHIEQLAGIYNRQNFDQPRPRLTYGQVRNSHPLHNQSTIYLNQNNSSMTSRPIPSTVYTQNAAMVTTNVRECLHRFPAFYSNWTHKQVIPLKTATSLYRQQIMMSTRTLGYQQDCKSYHQNTKETLQCFCLLSRCCLPSHYQIISWVILSNKTIHIGWTVPSTARQRQLYQENELNQFNVGAWSLWIWQ